MIDSLKMLDRYLLLKINSMHTPLMDSFMWFMSESWPTILIVAAVAYSFHRKFSAKRAVEFLVGCAIVFACTDLSSNAIKHGVKRYRPTHNTEIKAQVHVVNDYHGGKYSFFSGHSANTFGVVAFIFLSINWLRPRFKALLFFYPLLVGYSRMYLGVHYPSDIFVGMIDGLLFAWLIYFITSKYFFKPYGEKA
jgi:undecaprenyl-diphosphatase